MKVHILPDDWVVLLLWDGYTCLWQARARDISGLDDQMDSAQIEISWPSGNTYQFNYHALEVGWGARAGNGPAEAAVVFVMDKKHKHLWDKEKKKNE